MMKLIPRFFRFAPLAFMALAVAGCAAPHGGKPPASPAMHEPKTSASPIPDNAETTVRGVRADASFSFSEYEQKLRKKAQAESRAARLPGLRLDRAAPMTRANGRLYSFSTRKRDIKSALAFFAAHNGLNIVTDKNIKGKVTVSFHNVPLKAALKAILEPSGYYAVEEDGVIFVRDMEDATLEIDYPRFHRAVNGASSAFSGSGLGGGLGGTAGTTTTTGTTGTTGGAAGGNSSSVSINSSDNIEFLDELEKELKSLLSAEGKLAINKLSGTIQVHDHHRNVQAIRRYLQSVKDAIHRQVVIVATIMTVDTGDTLRHGVDWNLLATRVQAATSTAITNPLGLATGGVVSPALNATLQNRSKTIKSVIQALREQGDVEIISRPHVRTINNQPAMIKVGTDRTFFSIQSTTTVGTGGTTTSTNELRQEVTVGLVMSITPQISADGKVTLNIDPVITGLNGTDTSVNGSQAPRLDVKQLSSVVRVRSGETVVIGGLIDRAQSEQTRGLPILGDIPFIGGLFTTKEKIKQNKELVIFLTPYVVQG